MRVLSRLEWIVLYVILVYSFIPTFGGLIRVLELMGGPAIAPPNPRALNSPAPIVLHILSSFVFCLFGAVQFLPSLRRTKRAFHRINGRMVFFAGLTSAASGLWMTHAYAFPSDLQGPLLYWVRIVLGASMIGFLIWAIVAIKARNIVQHSAYMLRAYAIGQGASTQTILGLSWLAVVGSEAAGPAREALMVGAWVLNIMVVEILIWQRWSLIPKPRQKVPLK